MTKYFLQMVTKTKKRFHVKSETTESFIVFHFWHCLGSNLGYETQ